MDNPFVQFLVMIAKAMIPPRDFSNPARVYQWAVLITVMTMANFAGNVIITLAALGHMTFLYPGTASAQDLRGAMAPLSSQIARIQENQKKDQIRGLDNDLRAARAAECQAEKTDNGSAKSFAETRMSDLYAEYQRETGSQWRVPDCIELN